MDTVALDKTYWKRVRYNQDLGVPWSLKLIEGQGYAAFATRAFKKGEFICSEFPMLYCMGHHPFDEHQLEEIDNKVAKLSKEDQEAFYDMANVFLEDEPNRAAGVFMTNCFDMTESIYGECCAMYVALARLNHSCRPNAQQTHYPDTTEEFLYASRDIAEGEEINDCYIELRQPRRMRQEALRDIYRFDCACNACRTLTDSDEILTPHVFVNSTGCATNRTAACMNSEAQANSSSGNISNSSSIRSCSSPPKTQLTTRVASQLLTKEQMEQDDTMRRRAGEYSDIVLSMIGNDELASALDFTEDIIRKMSQPRYLLWSVRYLAEACLTAYQICDSIEGEEDRAFKWLTEANKMNIMLQGAQSPESKRTTELLQKFRK